MKLNFITWMKIRHLDQIDDICEVINMDPFEIIMTYGNTRHVDANNEILYI
jgi:hypothetical protein